MVMDIDMAPGTVGRGSARGPVIPAVLRSCGSRDSRGVPHFATNPGIAEPSHRVPGRTSPASDDLRLPARLPPEMGGGDRRLIFNRLKARVVDAVTALIHPAVVDTVPSPR